MMPLEQSECCMKKVGSKLNSFAKQASVKPYPADGAYYIR